MAFINPYADAGISKDDVLTVGINGQDPVTVASKEREECAEALGGTFRTDFYKDANGGEHFYDKDSGLSEWEWIENKQKEVGHLTRAGADERPSNYIYTYKTYDLGGELGQVRVREDEQKDFEASVSAQGLQPREVSTQRWNGVDVSGYSEQLEDVFSRFSKNGRLTDDQMLVMGATEEAIAAGKENMQHRIDKIDESLRAKGEIGFLEHEATTRGLNTIGRQADSIGDKIAMYGTEAVDAVTLDLYWTPGEMAKHFGGEDGLEKIKNMDWIDTMRIAFMSGESIFDIKSNPEAFHARMQEMNNNIHAQDHVVGVRGLTTGARVGSSAIDMAKAGLEFATTAYLAVHTGYFAPVAAPIIYAAGHLPDAYNEQIANRVFFNPATGQIEKVADGRKGGEALAYAVGGVALDYVIEQYGGKIAGAALKPIVKPMKSFATRILGKEMSTVLGLTPGIVKNWKGGGVIKKSAMKMSQAYHSLARNPWGKVVQSGIRGATPSGILEELNEEALQAFAEGALNIRGELDLERGRIADGSMLEGLRGVVDVYKNAPEFAATLVLYNIGAGPVSRGVNRAVSTYGNASTLRQALQWRGYTKEQLKGMSRQDIQSAFRKEYMTGSPEAQAKVEAEMLERHKTAEGMLTELQNHEMPQGTELLQLEDGSYNVKITDNEGNETVLTDQEEIRSWAAARLGDVAGKFGYNAFLTQEQMQKVSNAIMFMSREELDNVSRLLRETGVNKAFEVFGNDPDMVDAMQQALSMQYLANSKMYANTPMGQVFRIKSDAMFREMARREALQDADAVDAAFGEFYRYANGIAVEGEQISKDDIKPIFTPEELRTGGTVRDGGAKTWEKNGILLTQLQDGTFRVRLEDTAHRTATRSFASQGEALEYLNSLGAKKAKSDERFNALKLQAEQIYDSLYNNGQGGQRNMLVLHNAYENSAITKDLYKHYERSRYFGRMSFDEFVASVPAIRAPNGGLVLFTDNITTLSGLTSAIRHEGMHTGLQQMFDLDGKTGDAGVKAFIERVLPIFENAGDKFVLRDAVGDEVDLRNFDKYGPATQAYMLDEAMAYLCEIVSVNPSLGEKVNSIFGDTLFKGNKALSGMTTAQRNREVRTLIAESFARVHNPERGAALRRWHEMAGAADLRQYGVPEEVNTTYAVPRGSSGDIERRGYRGIKLPPPSNDTDTETTLQERVKNKKKRKQEVRKQAEQVVEERIEKERENLRKPKRKKRGKAEAVKPEATEVKQTAVQGEVVDAPVKEKKAEQKPTQEVITVTAPQPVEEYKERVTEFVNNAKDKRLAKAVVCEELLDAVRAYEALAGEMDGDLAAEIHARKLFLEEVLKRLNDDNVAAETPVNALPPAEAKPAETPPVAPKAEEGTTPTEEKPSSTTPTEDNPVPETTETVQQRAESAKKVLVEEVVGKHSRRQKVFDEATARWLEFNPADGKTIGDLTEDETFSLLVDLYIRNTLGSDNRVLSDESFLALADKSGLELATVSNEINKLYTACEEAKVFKKNNASKKTVSRAKQWGLDTETLVKVGEKELPKLRESFGNNTLISLNDVTPRDFATAIASFRARSESHFEPLTLKIGALSNNQSSMLASRILYGLWDRQFDKLSKTANATRKRHENKLAINKDILRLLKASKIDLTFEFDKRYASGIATMLEAINADAKSDPKLFVPTALSEWRKFVHDIPNTALDAIADIKVDKSRVDKLVMNLDYAANGGRRYSMKTIKDLEESLLYAILNGCHQFQQLKQEVGVINSTIEGLYDLNSAGSRQDVAVNQVYSRMQFIGERGATKEEKEGLKVAKQMLRDYGYTAKRLIDSRDTDTIIDINEELFNETGWFVGLDGKWRFETDYIEDIFEDWDDAAEFFRLRDKQRQLGNLTESEHVKMVSLESKLASRPHSLYELCKNKELFKRYPALKNVRIMFNDVGDRVGGSYNYDIDAIVYNTNPKNSIPPYRVIVHEVQHAIQKLEGFAKGTNEAQMEGAIFAADLYAAGRKFSKGAERLSNKNPAERIAATIARIAEENGGLLTGRDAYMLASGEIESREAESRAMMTPEERVRETPGYFYGVDQRESSAYQDAITFFTNDEIDTLITDATEGFKDDEFGDFGDFSIQESQEIRSRASMLESAVRGEKPEQLSGIPDSNIRLVVSSEKTANVIKRTDGVEQHLANLEKKKFKYDGKEYTLSELYNLAMLDGKADKFLDEIIKSLPSNISSGGRSIPVEKSAMLIDEKSSPVLSKLWSLEAPVVVPYTAVAKILERLNGFAFGSTNSHFIPRSEVDKLLYELDNPLAVYEKDNALVFVTNLVESKKNDGQNNRAVIILNKKQGEASESLYFQDSEGGVKSIQSGEAYYEISTAFSPEHAKGLHKAAIEKGLKYINIERINGIEFDGRKRVDVDKLRESDILRLILEKAGTAQYTQENFMNNSEWDPNGVYNKAGREAMQASKNQKAYADWLTSQIQKLTSPLEEVENRLQGVTEDNMLDVAADLEGRVEALPQSAYEVKDKLRHLVASLDFENVATILDDIKSYDKYYKLALRLVKSKISPERSNDRERILGSIKDHRAKKVGIVEVSAKELNAIKSIAYDIVEQHVPEGTRLQFNPLNRTDPQYLAYQAKVDRSAAALKHFGETAYDKVINAQGPLFRGVNKVLSTLGIKKEEVGDDLNVEASVKNVHGKIRNKVEQIHRQYLDPLRQLMKNHKLDAETLDEYLYAKFAPERNKMIQARTLVVDPNTGELISMDENGSGMSAEEAATINKRFMSDPKREAYDKAMHLVWEMNAKASEMMVKYGLVSNAQREMWRKLSPHYVPLLNLDANHFSRSMKKNLHLNGIPRRAKGRYTKAASPLAGSVYQMQEIIKRGERSNVNKTLAAFIQKYDAEGKVMGGRVLDFAGATKTVGKGDPMFVPNGSVAESIIRDYNQQENVKATGQEIELVETEDSKELGGKLVASGGIPETLRVKLTSSTAGAPNVVEYFEGGNRKFILFDKHNEEAVRIAEAANGTNILVPGAASSLEAPWRLTQRLTRWKADVSTTLNPKFVLRNMGADFFNTSMILMTEGKYKELGSFAKNYFAAMKTVRDFAKGKQIGDSELGKYYLEARENGMLTGVYGEGTFKEAAHKLSRDIKRMQGGSLRQGWEGFKEFMETIGSYPEQGARLAVYAAMRKRGMSPAQAAQYGREVTVDFNAKGEWTPVINTLYMFSNAGAQGVARAVKALQTGAADRGGGVQGYVRAAMPGIMVSLALGYLSSMMMDATGDDDEEDGVNTSKYARLPEHVKSNNVAIPFVGDTYIQLPTRGMWQSFTNLGTLIYDFQTGRKDAEEVVAGFTASMRDATDFIGGNAPTAGQWLAPTIFDPLVQVLEGKDWAGREIYRKDFGQGGANAHRGKNATGSLYKMLAEGLNSVTGGDKVKSGLIDLYPETYQLFTEFMLGSLAQLALNDVPNTLQTVAGAREAKANDLPAIGGVLRQSSDVESQYYTEFAKFDKVYKELKGYRKERMTAKTAEERQKWRDREQALIAKYPWARSADTLNAIASRITKLKKQTNERNEASIDAQIETQAKNFLRFIQKGQ